MRDEHGFFHFNLGSPIGNATVTAWLNQVRAELIRDGDCHHSMNSGDTAVVAVKYDDDVYIFVMQSTGWAKKVIPWAELPTADLTWERY